MMHDFINSDKSENLITTEDDRPVLFLDLDETLVCSKDYPTIIVRPGIRHFLRLMSTTYKMNIFSHGKKSYVMEVAKLLDPRKMFFSEIYSREHCDMLRQDPVKNLDKFSSNLEKTVLPRNLIMVKAFNGSLSDHTLMNLGKILMELSHYKNFQDFIHQCVQEVVE
ncbi:hypothetical protein A3Q56_00595 [Intoshia linei]|uniref:Mitochondrial import inner membrane translocase subunit TIM50 n=1 Tax=Intoshia linei TaxID=1819745 RepID=A0A177BDH1_9BILA|nr:hypothetical protein A3Q56_00595 [Intoshia linei]